MKNTIWKDVLYPGVVNKYGKRWSITAADLSRAAQNGNAMLLEGIHVPVCWEHQDYEPVPKSRADQMADQSRNTYGEAAGFRVRAGRLEVGVDPRPGEKPADLDRVKYTSPRLAWNFQTSDGKTWPGCSLLHVALTPQPEQNEQKPFRLNNGQLSLSLSMSDYEDDDMPADPNAPPDAGGDDFVDPNAAAEPDPGAEGEDQSMPALMDMLAQKGIMLPEGTTRDNVVEALLEVLENDPSAPGPGMKTDPAMATAGDQPPILSMSMSPHYSAHTNARLDRFARSAREGFDRRVTALVTGRKITAAQAEEMRKEIPALDLSFNGDGLVQRNEFVAKLEGVEKLAPSRSHPLHAAHAKYMPTTANAPQGELSADEQVRLWDKR